MQGNTELTALTQLAAQKSNPLVTLLPIIVIGLVFYFLLFRPQRKRQQHAAEMQRKVQPGQRVMTTAGMFATVVATEDNEVVLEVAPGVEARFVKQAIGQVIPDDVEDEADDEIEDEDEEVAETGEEETPKAGETLQSDVEAKTETLPGATAGNKTGDTSLSEDEDKSGKRH